MELDETGTNSISEEELGESKLETSKSQESEEVEENAGQVDAVMGGAPSASSYDEENNKDNTDDEEKISDSERSKVLALPKVRKLAEQKGVDLTSLNVKGRIREEDVLNADSSERSENDENVQKDSAEPANDERDSEYTDSSQELSQDMSGVDARPSVRKLAREHNIEISLIDGSGRGGEITREDVLDAAKTGTESKGSDNVKGINIESGDVERVEMSNIRKVTASNMSESRFTAPHVTHVEKADITELVALRESVKGEVDAHITYLPFIMKALLSGLKQHPNLNAELDEENSEVIRKKFYDFNIAVDTRQGLLVPKIEDVDDKNLIELAESIGSKVEKAQNNELTGEDMSNGTFSITNLGVIGGEAFTPIINYPQSAILGIGKIQKTAEVVNGEVVPRDTVTLSLSYDHRIVDGAEAARFMNKVVENLENPRELILEL